METKFLRFYLYSAIIISFINLVITAMYRITPSVAVNVIMGLATFFEVILIIITIIIIFHCFIHKIEKAFSILPVSYIVLYFVFAIYGTIIMFMGHNPLEFSSPPTIIGWILTDIYYILVVGYGIHLLRKKDLWKRIENQKKIKKEISTLGIVSIVVGLISFVPLIGFFLGIAAIILGILALTVKKSKLGWIGLILGIMGILITVGLYGGLFYFGYVKEDGIFHEMREEQSRDMLPSTVNAIEGYKARYGSYPSALVNLSQISDNPYMIYDPLQMDIFNPTNMEYYYEKKGDSYYLFSRGADGEPFTEDDIHPEFEDFPGLIGYEKPTK